MTPEQRKQLLYEQREHADFVIMNINNSKEDIHQMIKDANKINSMFSEADIASLKEALECLNCATTFLSSINHRRKIPSENDIGHLKDMELCLKYDNKWIVVRHQLGSYCCELIDNREDCTKFRNVDKIRRTTFLLKEFYDISKIKIVAFENDRWVYGEYNFYDFNL